MTTYLITPTRTITYEPVAIEADNDFEALEIFQAEEWITDDLTEAGSYFDYMVTGVV